MDLGDAHLLINRFAHVVNREQRDGYTGERFHFHAGLRDRSRSASDFGRVARRDDVDLHLADRQDVTKRNKLCGLFGGLDSGDSRGGKHIPFRDLILGNKIERFALKLDLPLGDRSADAQRFGGDIDHLRAAIMADVRETSHRSAADGDHLAVRLIIVAKIVL
jgi:hypothetical protein